MEVKKKRRKDSKRHLSDLDQVISCIYFKFGGRREGGRRGSVVQILDTMYCFSYTQGIFSNVNLYVLDAKGRLEMAHYFGD